MQPLDRTRQPEIYSFEPFTIQTPECYVMGNGLPVQIIRAGEAEVVRLDVMIGGGQWEQEQPLQSAYMCRMLREGTKRFSSGEIAHRLDFYGAWLEVSSSMNYAFVTLYSLKKYFAETVEVVASMLREPLFPEKEFAIVMEANRQQFLVNQHKVEVLARKQLNKALFGAEHPCGRYATLEDYDRLTTNALRRMHRRFVHSGNCTCYLSGMVDEQVLHQLESALGQEAWGEVSELTSLQDIQPQPMAEKQLFIERPEAVQSAVCMGTLTLDTSHHDYHKLRILVTLFGGYFGSRLMKNIREEKGYTYGIGAHLVSYPFRNQLMINTQAANEYARPIVEEVHREIKRLQDEKVTEEELTMVRNYTMGDMCRGYESPFSLADAYIYLKTQGLDASYFALAQEAIRTITADEVRELACRYLRAEAMTEVIAGKKV